APAADADAETKPNSAKPSDAEMPAGSDDDKAKSKDQDMDKDTDKDTSEKAKTKTKAKSKPQKATFGEGCFWSTEAVFEAVPGVKSVVSGYSGGSVPHPSYEMVCTGETGHAEAVQIEFDPDVVSYETLLKIFWASHDPTTLNRQGDDFGPQYRSVVFFHNEAQRRAAQKSYQKLTDTGAIASPIVTQLVPAQSFYPAERYHQNYYRNHRNDEYSQFYIIPKLKKLKTMLK
ncbi:peptide-methionine (S)-S-oxide reductase MsrA, partial [Singulisphaera rosea]